MASNAETARRAIDEPVAIRRILEGTACETGGQFFAALVKNVALALGTQGAWVTEYVRETRRLRALAFWMENDYIDHYEYDITNTPCEPVIEKACFVHFPEDVQKLFPDDPDLAPMGAVSYMGIALADINGAVLGHLAAIDNKPMPEEATTQALFRIFGARAGAELRRLRAEREIREREEKLVRLVDSAMDGIVELNHALIVTRVNRAAEKIFGCKAEELVGSDFSERVTSGSAGKLRSLIGELGDRPEGQQYLWIPGGLTAIHGEGEELPAEASLARFELNRESFYTLIVRNVNERLEAERRIDSLTAETQYLKEELREARHFGTIIGRSEPIQSLCDDIKQVAGTDTTVLVLGETGTGKELVARSIHAASGRADRPLIRINCAAIPGNLIESEFFGHERGAFTGATQKRQGRFELADGGTIFLDEVAELPLDLQSKILRILQEGEYEPVGSSRTRRVDVRVIAATNRDLKEMMNAGRFREDLYYRLAVFPITVPPLRDRGDDVLLLATAFMENCAAETNCPLVPLRDRCRKRLMAYDWPGNVRELQNVIERALITGRDGRLNLDRALPEDAAVSPPGAPASLEPKAGAILTAAEMRNLERNNIIAALEESGWQVAGKRGAAQRLGMHPSTLSSRIKALNINRPR